jgi:RHS repeat-associated protein
LTNSSTTYHHSDHLSVRVSTDANGNKIGEQGHYPYGESWYSANTTTKFIFTSYERDSESGNDYAMGRYYFVTLGRFCTVDPVSGSPGDPQSWNRYVYVRDNPINMTDPSGFREDAV